MTGIYKGKILEKWWFKAWKSSNKWKLFVKLKFGVCESGGWVVEDSGVLESVSVLNAGQWRGRETQWAALDSGTQMCDYAGPCWILLWGSWPLQNHCFCMSELMELLGSPDREWGRGCFPGRTFTLELLFEQNDHFWISHLFLIKLNVAMQYRNNQYEWLRLKALIWDVLLAFTPVSHESQLSGHCTTVCRPAQFPVTSSLRDRQRSVDVIMCLSRYLPLSHHHHHHSHCMTYCLYHSVKNKKQHLCSCALHYLKHIIHQMKG